MKRIAIYGSGYLGQQVLHHVNAYYADDTQIIGFIDDTKPPGLVIAGGLTSLGSLSDAAKSDSLDPSSLDIVFAIGYSSMRARRKALDRVGELGYRLFQIVHPRSVIEPGASVGPGSIVLGGAILDQQVEIGKGCFVDVGVRLGAGTRVGDNVYLSSGTSTGSRVQIGDDCFFGMDSTITTDVSIASHVFVNAKSLVSRDIETNLKLVEVHKSKLVRHS